MAAEVARRVARLEQLERAYATEEGQGDEDVRRVVEDFFKTCRELADWLWKDKQNTGIDESAVRALMRDDPLRLADAMAQTTTKHHTTWGNNPITARRCWFNYVCVWGMLLAPVAALITLGGDPGSAPLVLTAIGLVLTIAGPLLVSNRLAEPNYDLMLAWDPDAMPANWEATRKRYFALNWIRAAVTWTAFALVLAALVAL